MRRPVILIVRFIPLAARLLPHCGGDIRLLEIRVRVDDVEEERYEAARMLAEELSEALGAVWLRSVGAQESEDVVCKAVR